MRTIRSAGSGTSAYHFATIRACRSNTIAAIYKCRSLVSELLTVSPMYLGNTMVNCHTTANLVLPTENRFRPTIGHDNIIESLRGQKLIELISSTFPLNSFSARIQRTQ